MARSLARRHFLIIAVLALLVVALIGAPRPLLAQSGCPTVSADTPTVTGVLPAAINNSVGNTITVTGTLFQAGAVVLLEGYGALTTTCLNPVTLTATVPAGIPGEAASGVLYRVVVINANGNDSAENVQLRVFAPPPPPPPTNTPGPTATPAPTAFVRPIVTVQSYGASSQTLRPGERIDFEITLQNTGQIPATNIVVTFGEGDLVPRSTGGVQSIPDLVPGATFRFFQPFTVSSSLSGRIAKAIVKVDYTDAQGTKYSETFTLSFDATVSSGTAPTPTPTPGLRPQFVVSSYRTSDERLQAGDSFDLVLELQNVGASDARGVTLIVGGGSASDGAGGTPAPGGVSGGGGSFDNFAPIGASNVQVLGDIAAGGRAAVTQPLVVNVTTKPGAYPLKITLTYTNPAGQRFTDDQVVTLLIFTNVQIEVNTYQPLMQPATVGQPLPLPLQAVNLGSSSVVLGNMRISSSAGQVEQNEILIGLLDAGGFFIHDATFIPETAGSAEIVVEIAYNDDFNQPQVIRKTLSIEVLDTQVLEPIPGSEMPVNMPEAAPETLMQKLWRFIKGLLGFDSAPPEPSPMPMMEQGISVSPAGGGGGGGGEVPPDTVIVTVSP